jgi:hypothetical protein
MARTARLAALLIGMITSWPRCISTTVCIIVPPSNAREAPWVRLVRPEVIAARLLARAWGKLALSARGRPSEDTTTACAAAGTPLMKLSASS